jgi:Zn-dependent M32 family carboxypeptidase
MEGKLQELKSLLMEVDDLDKAGALLGWDQTTYMRAGCAACPAK